MEERLVPLRDHEAAVRAAEVSGEMVDRTIYDAANDPIRVMWHTDEPTWPRLWIDVNPDPQAKGWVHEALLTPGQARTLGEWLLEFADKHPDYEIIE